MKRTVMLFVVLCALLPSVFAQTIQASPFEGHWVWDKKGEAEPEAVELIFFGNVMLIIDDGNPLVGGGEFSFYGESIICEDSNILWQYRIAGNVLSIVTEDDEQFSYTRTKITKSPLEGIWKVVTNNGQPLDQDGTLLFVGDIMAIMTGHYGGYQGGQIAFTGKYIHPVLSDEDMKNVTEEKLSKAAMKYIVKGKSLSLSIDGNELTLLKVY